MTPLTEEEKLAYQTVAARRAQFDAAVWSTPALSITALTFTLTITANPDIPLLIRVAAGALGVFLGLAAIALMRRHRIAELADAAWLANMEVTHGMPVIHGEAWLTTQTEPRWRMPRWWRYVNKVRVYHLWLTALFLFTAGALLLWVWVLATAL